MFRFRTALALGALLVAAACSDSPVQPTSPAATVAAPGGSARSVGCPWYTTCSYPRLDMGPDPVSIYPGQSVQMWTQYYDFLGTPQNSFPQGWLTGDGSIASVSGSGVVTGVAVGNTWVMANYNGMVGSAMVYVVAPPPQPFSVSTSGTNVIRSAGFYTYTATAANGTPPYSYTWASSDDGVTYYDEATGSTDTRWNSIDEDTYLRVTATDAAGHVAQSSRHIVGMGGGCTTSLSTTTTSTPRKRGGGGGTGTMMVPAC